MQVVFLGAAIQGYRKPNADANRLAVAAATRSI
jgi:hypothetical protein